MSRKNRFDYASQPEQQPQPEVLAEQAQPGKVVQPEGLERPGGAAHALREPGAYALPPQQRGKRAGEGEVRRTDVPREQLNVRIRPELKRAAASVAALQGLTLGDIVETALIEYIRRKNEATGSP
ncbi:hypothetical protein [Deinococcus fonticola]|uniref:hypothetical protein n=1 Tax=Deinococcus fonticola TaxID=2528713 RepID=UPI001074EB72|nr:hypothetical protein [Deinococcus fonticola]